MIKLIVFAALFSVSAWAEDTLTDKIEGIYKQFLLTRSESKEVKIKHLIQLDQELRTLIYRPRMRANQYIATKYWKEKYLSIGISVGHFSDALEYSGKLLVKARTLDVDAAK